MSAAAPEAEPTAEDAREQDIPSSLPILPLRDAIVYPDSMSPLAVGQERSIRLVDEAVVNPSVEQ